MSNDIKETEILVLSPPKSKKGLKRDGRIITKKLGIGNKRKVSAGQDGTRNRCGVLGLPPTSTPNSEQRIRKSPAPWMLHLTTGLSPFEGDGSFFCYRQFGKGDALGF